MQIDDILWSNSHQSLAIQIPNFGPVQTAKLLKYCLAVNFCQVH